MSVNECLAMADMAKLQSRFKDTLQHCHKITSADPEVDDRNTRYLAAAQRRFDELIHLLDAVTGRLPLMHGDVRELGEHISAYTDRAVAALASFGTGQEHDENDMEAVMQRMDEASQAIDEASIAGSLVVIHLAKAYRLIEQK